MEVVELFEKLTEEVVETYVDKLADGVTEVYRKLTSSIMEVIGKHKELHDLGFGFIGIEEETLSSISDLRKLLHEYRISKRLDKCFRKLEKCI